MLEHTPDITIVRAIETCSAVPNQWDCWDKDGNYWYLKYRSGRGTISRTYDIDDAVAECYDNGDSDITFEHLCVLLGVSWCLDLDMAGVLWQAKPA